MHEGGFEPTSEYSAMGFTICLLPRFALANQLTNEDSNLDPLCPKLLTDTELGLCSILLFSPKGTCYPLHL